MMVGRRKPLVLSSTKILVNSVLSSTRLNEACPANLSGDGLRLKAGILRVSKDKNGISDSKLASLDDSALIGLSTSTLKRLSITSGSLVSLSFCFDCLKFSGKNENFGTFSLIEYLPLLLSLTRICSLSIISNFFFYCLFKLCLVARKTLQGKKKKEICTLFGVL